MKRILKIFLYVIGFVVVIAAGGLLYIHIKGIPTYETQVIEYKAKPTTEHIERGKKLATVLCANCHMNMETRKMTGRHMLDAPKEFGYAYAPNITNDEKHGIGGWTDGEILYLLRTGLKPNGEYAPPWMAKLPNMSDDDIESIIAFLRSDDPMVASDPTPDKPCEPSFLTKFLCQVAFKPFDYPLNPIPEPDTSDVVAWGRYLVVNLECFSCHSADFKTNDYLIPENSEGYLGGGNLPLDQKGNPMPTQNITPDKETGIGAMSEEAFVKLLKYGIKQDEPAMRYPMMPYSVLSDNEASAIYAYLQTVPEITNEVPRAPYE